MIQLRHIKKHIFLVAACLLATISNAQTTLNYGPISGTLSKAGSPYFIKGDLLVPKDSTLTLEAGVVFHFDTARIMRIDGNIKCMGTEQDPILMTCLDSMTGWMGMFFIDNADQDTSVFNYVKIEYVNYPAPLINSPLFTNKKHSNGRRYRPMVFWTNDAAPIILYKCKLRRNWQTFEIKNDL